MTILFLELKQLNLKIPLACTQEKTAIISKKKYQLITRGSTLLKHAKC